MDASRAYFDDADETVRATPVPGGITGFRGITEFGVIDDPSKVIKTWREYQANFGGLIPNSDFPLICKQALDGGSSLRISRVAHYTDVADKTTLTAVKATPIQIMTTSGQTLPDLLLSEVGSFDYQSTRGQLVPGTYNYRVSWVNGAGQETLPSPNLAVELVAPSNVIYVYVAVNPPAGAVKARIYKNGTEYFDVPVNNAQYSDDGTAGTAGVPPTENNTTSGANLFKVEVKYEGATVPEVRITNATNGLAGSFNVEIWMKGKRVELYENKAIVGRPTVNESTYLKGATESSTLVNFIYQDLSEIPGVNQLRPANGTSLFVGGSDGGVVTSLDYIGNRDSKVGLYSFDGQNDMFQIAIPEISDEDVHTAGGLYADARGDIEYWAHLDNSLTTPTAIIASREDVLVDSKYISYFAGGAKILHPITGNEVEISELGEIAAIQAYVDRSTSLGPWRSAANYVNGSVRNANVVGVVNNFGGDGMYPERNDLANRQINLLINDSNRIYLSGNYSGQTESSKASFRNVVRGVIYLKKALYPTLQKYLEEPPEFNTFRRLYSEVEPIFRDLETKRFFAINGEDRGWLWQGDQDATTYDELVVNTPEDLSQGKYRVILFIKPLGSIIEIRVTITISEEGVDFSFEPVN